MKKLKVCWISAGISSFMAGYLAGNVDEWIYIDISDQHPDSIRFIKDCEKAIGKEIQIMKSREYRCVEDCVRVFGGFRSPANNFAPCTGWLKKRVRKEWEEKHKDYELTYVWGFDLAEKERAERTVEANPQANHEFPLIENYLSKEDVHGLFERTLILPDQKCMTWVIRTITVSGASKAEWVIGIVLEKISQKFSRVGRSWKDW